MTDRRPTEMRVVEVADDDYSEWLARMLGGFSLPPVDDEDAVAFLSGMYPLDRALAVTNGQGFVATSAAIDLDLVLPGGSTVPMAGITAVTVDSTVKRQGILRRMMTRLHRRAMDEGRPVAGLLSSEWPIYGRFGYGPASWCDALTVEVPAVGWRHDAPGHDLALRRIGPEEARELAPVLHTAVASTVAGEVVRPVLHWSRLTLPSAAAAQLDVVLGHAAAGAGPAQYVAVADRGLVCYRVIPGWSPFGTPAGSLLVTDVLATDLEAEAALWRHLLNVNLVVEVQVPRVSVDHPLRWWVTDARRLRASRHDGLWLRPLDTLRLLEARTWTGDGELTLRVHDTDGYADGNFRLRVEDGHATVSATTAEPDLEMGVDALGSIVLGGTRATSLARGGRIQARDKTAPLWWDRLATPPGAPFISASF